MIDAKDMTNVGPSKRGLAMVFQSYALYPHMSVRNNIAFALKMAGQSADAIEQKVKKAASTLAIAPILILGWFSQKQLVRGLTFGAVK